MREYVRISRKWWRPKLRSTHMTSSSESLKTTAVVADRVWHFEVREDSDGQFRASGQFLETHLEKVGPTADDAERDWIAAAKRIATDRAL
jgi:hypothetical protein